MGQTIDGNVKLDAGMVWLRHDAVGRTGHHSLIMRDRVSAYLMALVIRSGRSHGGPWDLTFSPAGCIA